MRAEEEFRLEILDEDARQPATAGARKLSSRCGLWWPLKVRGL